MKLLVQQNQVLSEIIRFDTADGEMIMLRATDDPAMAQMSRSFNDADSIVDSVAWETLLP